MPKKNGKTKSLPKAKKTNKKNKSTNKKEEKNTKTEKNDVIKNNKIPSEDIDNLKEYRILRILTPPLPKNFTKKSKRGKTT